MRGAETSRPQPIGRADKARDWMQKETKRVELVMTEFHDRLFSNQSHFSTYAALPPCRGHCVQRSVTVGMALDHARVVSNANGVSWLLFEAEGLLYRISGDVRPAHSGKI